MTSWGYVSPPLIFGNKIILIFSNHASALLLLPSSYFSTFFKFQFEKPLITVPSSAPQDL